MYISWRVVVTTAAAVTAGVGAVATAAAGPAEVAAVTRAREVVGVLRVAGMTCSERFTLPAPSLSFYSFRGLRAGASLSFPAWTSFSFGAP